jgi:hypothetical protein
MEPALVVFDQVGHAELGVGVYGDTGEQESESDYSFQFHNTD